MAKKSGMERAGDLAHFAKALYDIIKAFMQGGWASAALQALKHYWPQILAIALVLLLLPVIIFCCLPMMLFGWSSSTNTDVSSMTAKASNISSYYDNYETYIDEGVANVMSQFTDSDGENTETNGTTHQSDDTEKPEYEIVYSGSKIQKNWFIALHAVKYNNDLNAVNETEVRSFADNCFMYTVASSSENTENTSEDSTVTIINIHYCTPTEIMTANEYSDADKNWARLIFKTLEMENNSDVGMLGSLFSDSGWRNNITSEYGYRTDPSPGFHHGLDVGMPTGTEICAVKDGTVSLVVRGTTGYGYYVVLDHENGIQTVYAHCSELLVSEGDTVNKGTVIAKVGSTGDSTGPHCHFEVRINGEQVNPLPYLP